jgi:hypothetical protein
MCASMHPAGITCHFCRQKKLCGEEDCPRCSRRSTTAECIGKTDCSRCHSAYGRFCRACLLIRYGQTMEVRYGQQQCTAPARTPSAHAISDGLQLQLRSRFNKLSPSACARSMVVGECAHQHPPSTRALTSLPFICPFCCPAGGARADGRRHLAVPPLLRGGAPRGGLDVQQQHLHEAARLQTHRWVFLWVEAGQAVVTRAWASAGSEYARTS